MFVASVMVIAPEAIVIGAGFGFVTLRFNDWLTPGEKGAVKLPVIVNGRLLNTEKVAGVATPVAVAVTV